MLLAYTQLDYSIVCITIKSRTQAGDISGRVDTGIYETGFLGNTFSFFPLRS